MHVILGWWLERAVMEHRRNQPDYPYLGANDMTLAKIRAARAAYPQPDWLAWYMTSTQQSETAIEALSLLDELEKNMGEASARKDEGYIGATDAATSANVVRSSPASVPCSEITDNGGPFTFEHWYSTNGYYHDTVSDRKELMYQAWLAAWSDGYNRGLEVEPITPEPVSGGMVSALKDLTEYVEEQATLHNLDWQVLADNQVLVNAKRELGMLDEEAEWWKTIPKAKSEQPVNPTTMPPAGMRFTTSSTAHLEPTSQPDGLAPCNMSQDDNQKMEDYIWKNTKEATQEEEIRMLRRELYALQDRRAGHSKLVVTKDGVPYADQAQGIRDFREACNGIPAKSDDPEFSPEAGHYAWQAWLYMTDTKKCDRDVALMQAIHAYLYHVDHYKPKRESGGDDA